jgi:hypothetical protein
VRSLVAAGAVAGLAACPTLFAPHDDESDARSALASLAEHGTRFPAAGAEVVFPRLTLSEITVGPGASPDVLLHVIGTGTWANAALGYYGSEHVQLRRRAGAFLPAGPWLPKLFAVLEALAAADAAMAARDAGALARLATPDYRDGAVTPRDFAKLLASEPLPPGHGAFTTLSIRIDGDRAEVTRSAGDGGPVRGSTLVRRNDFWLFSSGLL